jgi:hypothetical protein
MPCEDWREPYINFIRDQRLLAGMDARSVAAARVMRRNKGFVLLDNKLYRRGVRLGGTHEVRHGRRRLRHTAGDS